MRRYTFEEYDGRIERIWAGVEDGKYKEVAEYVSSNDEYVLASDVDELERRYREAVELLRSVLDKSEVSENSKLGEDINAFLAGEEDA